MYYTKTLKTGLLIAYQFLFTTALLAQSKFSNDSIRVVQEALQMIHLPEPTFESGFSQEMDAKALDELGFNQVYESEGLYYTLKDGGKLFATKFSEKGKTSIILLHGALSNSFFYNKMAGLLRQNLNAEVIALDLRGHGKSTGRPGDVDYIGQYADDLIDVVKIIKKEKPDNKIILAGHSMGGGIILNFAERQKRPEVDAYLLIAPALGNNSPTLPQKSTIDKNSGESFLKVHLPRSIGLYMLNQIGNHAYDSLNVLFYNLPDDASINKYSYRSAASMAPADYRMALKAVDKPMLVLVGGEDEAFIASEFEPAVQMYSRGKVVLVEGATHNGIRHEEAAMKAIKFWAKENGILE